MSLVLPEERRITLQLKIHSKDSERRIKKWLLGIQGVSGVNFDVKRGVVIVSGTIDPPKLLMMLDSYGVKAEIFGHQRRPAAVSPPVDIIPLNDPDIAALLKHLPINSAGLETMEITKTVKFDFQVNNGGRGNKNLEITRKYRGGVDHKPHGGGLCGASSSCCGDHHAPLMNHMHCCGCCPHGCPRRSGIFSCANSGGYFPMSLPQPGYWGFSPLRAPPWVAAAGVPSAPPLPEDDNSPASPPPPPPPPPGTNPFYMAFSDENTNSCTIM